jgi:hypothetical protein
MTATAGTTTSASTDSMFQLPPIVADETGNVRVAGFEFEYAGLDLQRSAQIVQQVFGGRHEVDSTFVHRVAGTRFGDFAVEIDTSLLKDKRYESAMRAVGLDPQKLDRGWVENIESALLSVASTLVPIEIVAPPIPVTELAPLEELRRMLFEAGAKGTRASLLYAFGLHINPRVPTLELRSLLDHLRAFLVLYPWIAKKVEADIARRVTPYINPFPPAYARLVLAPEYGGVTPAKLIDDYLAHNPTRNRPLDMLPVLACLDHELIKRQSKDPHLVKPRPAFHYRMPNCLVDEGEWRVAGEWNTWVGVERLAADERRLAQMSREYLGVDAGCKREPSGSAAGPRE